MAKLALKVAAKGFQKAAAGLFPKAPAALTMLGAAKKPLLIGPGGPVKAGASNLPMLHTPLANQLIPYAGKPFSSYKYSGSSLPTAAPKYSWTRGNDAPTKTGPCFAAFALQATKSAEGIFGAVKEADKAKKAQLAKEISKDMSKAVDDLKKCLKKQRAPESLIEESLKIATGKLKDTVEAKLLSLDAKKVGKAVKDVEAALKKNAAADEGDHKKALAQRKNVEAIFDGFVNAAFAGLADYGAAHAQLQQAAQNTTDAYMAAIKKTNGLTKGLPSAVKALEKLRQSQANAAFVGQVDALRATATNSLTEHSRKVVADNPGNALAAGFETALLAIIASL